MDWVWFLFSFEGRINRAKYWLAGLVILCWMIFLLFLFVVLSAAFGDFRSFGLDTGLVNLHAKLDGPRSFHLGINDIFALVDPATWRALPRTDIATALAHAVVTPLMLWVFLAVSVKRLHDRDKSGWWMVLFFAVPGIYKQFEDRLPDSYFLLPIASAVFVFTPGPLPNSTASRARAGPTASAPIRSASSRRGRAAPRAGCAQPPLTIKQATSNWSLILAPRRRPCVLSGAHE